MATFGIEYLLRQSTTLGGLVAVFVTLGLVTGRRWRLHGRPLVGDLTFFYTQGLFTRAAVLLDRGTISGRGDFGS